MIRKLFRLAFPRRVRLPSGVHFHHHSGTGRVPNLGDFLCTPKHYFVFESDRPALILGGGAFNGLGTQTASTFKASVRVCWAVGQSLRFDQHHAPLDRSSVNRVYAIATTRDPSIADGKIGLLPCVSVLHPIVDMPVGDRRGMILNFNPDVSGDVLDQVLAKYRDDGFLVSTNATPADEFFANFRQIAELTTNSYHAAYWGLLSGRRVRLVGYSSKFVDLLALFGIGREHVEPYARGSGEALKQAVLAVAAKEPISLASAEDCKDRFRSMNLEFARSLEAVGIRARAVENRAVETAA